jgi:AAA15 family ATPase/GTPase
MSNKRIREMANILVKDLDLKLMLKPKEKKIEIAKQKDDMIFSYPYITTSDTLQRVIFFTAAMESNEKSTLIFEEPESFAFPYYTKYLGERIAFDKTNQFFISTHNPYLLLSILEKTSKDSVNVFVTYLKDYETKVKAMTDEEIPVLMYEDTDPFFNLGYFLEEE